MSNIFDLFKKIEKEKASAIDTGITHIVCGLGNPGAKYEMTRHNAGYMAMSYISQKENISIDKLKFKSLCKTVQFADHKVLFMLPQTFMNLSGEAVVEAAKYYKIPSENIIVIYDDISLPCGKMRIRTKGSAGGHNGIKNIIYHLETDVFPRIKLGVGTPPDPSQLVEWVLGKIPKSDQDSFYTTVENAYDACKLIINDKIDKAMNLYN